MMLLDASTIIDALRSKDVQLIERMTSLDGAVCGVTRAEVLSGARGQQDRMRLQTILDGFQQVAIPDATWDEVGTVLSELRGSGITVPLADAVLAAVAMSLDVEVWASDAHFNRMQSVLADLRLHQESA